MLPGQDTDLHEGTDVGSVLSQAILRIAQTLALDNSVSRLEARVLASHAWQRAPSWLIAHGTDPLTARQLAQFHAMLERRLRGEPIAYITGTREFFGLTFHVSPAVLIPRPETELLVERVLAQLPADQAADILELGTGSGCIAISLALALPRSRLTAVDRDRAALSVATSNARELGARIEYLESDWYSALATRKYDYIVSNPPYVPKDDPHLHRGDVRFEPRHALAAGPLGLDALAHIIERAPLYLKPQGGLFLEHGYNQADDTAALMKKNRFIGVTSWQDLSGISRVTAGFLSE